MSPSNIQQVLKKYWGYDKFRPLQEDIIHAVLSKKDSIALLPTGGGKSICFQVPGLALDGITIVISPLVALMKDQVDNLKSKGIKAVCISSLMTYREIDIALDNCIYGSVKFLYVSPERILTELFIARLKKMNVALIAIDEAHCISQWGYDFRPSYLQIAKLREYLPKVPVIALTATATEEVISDIGSRLEMINPIHFRKSFERNNLSYLFLNESDKENRLIKIFRKTTGSGIVYARNRRLTAEIANLLQNHGISSDFYHAGLDPEQRNQKQADWIAGKVRVIVCTNAFGMGIDKPDVRVVVHYNPPDCIEAYFQEAGRAGRDGNLAYGTLLYDDKDISELEYQLKNAFPEKEEVRKVYQALVNFFQLATGSGKEEYLEFDFDLFCKSYNLNQVRTHKALDLLARNSYLVLTDAVFMPSRLMFKVNKNELYDYQLRFPKMDALIKVALRSYSGIFDEFVAIKEKDLAYRTKTSVEQVTKNLDLLNKHEIVHYIKQSILPKVCFPNGVIRAKDLFLDKETYELRKKQIETRNGAFIQLLKNAQICRSQQMLNYFGEKDAKPCGRCDVCLQRKAKIINSKQLLSLETQIVSRISEKPIEYEILIEQFDSSTEVIEIIRFLIGKGTIVQEGKWLKLRI